MFTLHIPAFERHSRLFTACIFSASLMIGVTHAEAVASSEGAGSFVTQMISRTLDELTDKTLTPDEREAKFSAIIDDTFAVDAVGKWVLGRYWRQSTPAERADFIEAFKEKMVRTHAHNFERFDPTDVHFGVKKTNEIQSGDYLVLSEIGSQKDAQNRVDINWRVKHSKDRYWIVDIMVEGISMGQAQRSEFASVMRRNGGSLQALINDLRALDSERNK